MPPSETAVQPAVAIKQRDAVLDSRLAVRVTGAAGVAESSVS